MSPRRRGLLPDAGAEHTVARACGVAAFGPLHVLPPEATMG